MVELFTAHVRWLLCKPCGSCACSRRTAHKGWLLFIARAGVYFSSNLLRHQLPCKVQGVCAALRCALCTLPWCQVCECGSEGYQGAYPLWLDLPDCCACMSHAASASVKSCSTPSSSAGCKLHLELSCSSCEWLDSSCCLAASISACDGVRGGTGRLWCAMHARLCFASWQHTHLLALHEFLALCCQAWKLPAVHEQCVEGVAC